MAVPKHLALPHFNGTFSLQGVPYALRKVFKLAKIKLNIVVEPIGPDDAESKYRFIIKSSIIGLGVFGAAPLRAVGFPTENSDERILDGSEQDKDEPVIGKTKSRIWLCLLEEVLTGAKDGSSTTTSGGEGIAQTDDFLKQDWEGHDAGKTYVVRLSIWSVNPGESEPWRNEQVWGIQKGRWTGRVAFTKGAVKETARLMYDYES
ncbi:hypothetical protein DL767_010051 [Monosporascus sp. MG133]|nr:hypothetical protein DL767_010051 [Monosporascus sp. MG133]